MSTDLNSPLTLPCGVVLQNRLAKAAMTERLTNSNCRPNAHHFELYRRWGEQGVGLLITGNMMVDHRYMESAGNIAPLFVDDEEILHRQMQKDLQTMAKAARGAHNGEVWVQLNHPGRQCTRFVNNRPLSASDVQLHKVGFFARPRPMSVDQINMLISQYRETALMVKEAGFTGIQIHAAHGYLLSQFLSPLTNLRTDEYGGSLENRARLLLEVVEAVRESCGEHFPISVKLNSADFQRGGFQEADALQVVKMLEQRKIDLLEVSGGNYENLAFFETEGKMPNDGSKRESTKAREAYFLDFAQKVRKECQTPIMLTGGIRSRAFADEVLEKGSIDVVGVARPFLLEANFGARFLEGETALPETTSRKVGWRPVDDLAEAGYWDRQVDLIARGKNPKPKLGAWAGLGHILWREFSKSIGKRISR
jgi:2,4-dienoyl-CoA reductase-like NADH-dependent reductase (Old Yellow Enzyme family)